MNPVTILVDMDNTIEGLAEAWAPWLNAKHGLSVKISDWKHWDVTKVFPSLNESQIWAPLQCEDFWKTVKAYPDAVVYLKKLIDAGNKVFIVTSSNYKTLQMKFDNVLFKYFPYLTDDNIIVAKQKQMIVGDILVDDCPNNFGGLYYHGILLHQPYNASFDERRYGIDRAFNWAEIYENIMRFMDDHFDDAGQWY